MSIRALASILVGLALVAAPAAEGDGGPSPGVVAGWDGVLSPSGAVRYVALIGGPTTTVAVVQVRGGRVVRSRWLRGGYGVPIVSYDGTTGGASEDGSTLVLASFANPRSVSGASRFAVLDPRNLRLRRSVVLRGSFSYDALSPDGAMLYLIQYVSARDFTRYRVRAYDVRSGRLLRRPIADEREPGEQMHGFPVARAASGDARWAFTLYGRDRGNAFVHALDTRSASARCIDLPWRIGRGDGATLKRVGSRLVVGRNGVRLGTVDTATPRVRG